MQAECGAFLGAPSSFTDPDVEQRRSRTREQFPGPGRLAGAQGQGQRWGGPPLLFILSTADPRLPIWVRRKGERSRLMRVRSI